MPFQFMCPRGHLLEGDESQAGHQCRCPQCGMMFIIPTPAAHAVLPEESGYAEEEYEEPAIEAAPEPRIFHIPCPKGHVLETPEDMLNQDVLCPHCNAQFRLRERDSLEERRKRQAEQERIHRRAAKNWLMWAVVIAVIVLAMVIGMIVISMMG